MRERLLPTFPRALALLLRSHAFFLFDNRRVRNDTDA